MFAIATSNFYKTANDVVFKAEVGSSKLREIESFEVEKNANFLQNKTKINFFSDDKQTSIKLKNDAPNLLQKHFSKQDFIRLDDGSVGLSGSANAYVEGWYKDILENRNFKSADMNQDGKIKGDEFYVLKNDVRDETSLQDLREFGHIVLRDTKKSIGYINNKFQEKSVSLNEILSQTIKSDKDFDGNLTRLEFATNGGSLADGYENLAKRILKKIGVNASTLIIDPENKIMSTMNGKSMGEVENIFSSKFDDNFLRVKIKPKSQEDEHINELLLRYPNLSSVIKNNPNISEEELQVISQKQKITEKYLNNEPNLDEEFTNLVLGFNYRI